MTDPILAMDADALRAEVRRLRARVHEVASDGQRERAKLEARVAESRRRYDAAKEATKDWRVDWTTDQAAQEPYGWWRFTSMVAADEAMVLLDRATTAEAAIGELAGLLHQAYVEVGTREVALGIRRALQKYDVDPEGT